MCDFNRRGDHKAWYKEGKIEIELLDWPWGLVRRERGFGEEGKEKEVMMMKDGCVRV